MRASAGPAKLRHVEATFACLREDRFSVPGSDRVWHALDAYVYGFTIFELRFPFRPEEYAEVARSYLPKLDADAFPRPRELTIEVAEGRYDGRHDFNHGLELLFAGLSPE